MDYFLVLLIDITVYSEFYCFKIIWIAVAIAGHTLDVHCSTANSIKLQIQCIML